ncbi:autophagy-related protein 2 [Rutidosis leptorrhynchoides]|uniref:autophagy-related protein 2 n=1 Tax=Rutidosis leptorrhynchoides TaxID=125765 RepID=UPI003A996852
MTPEHDTSNSTVIPASVDIHEGVKTIAKMVKWLLTSFHVKVKRLIIALEPSLEGLNGKREARTLVLRFGEVECGTGISEDVDLDGQRAVDGFLGLSRLTNFVKFDEAVLEFIQLDRNSDNLGEMFCGVNVTTPIITGEKDGVSGTIKLSIPWKNGSLDIRKLDADVYIDPLELRLHPGSLKSFMHFVNVFEELDNYRKSLKASESVYHSVSSSHGSFMFSSQKPETFSTESGKDSVFDALLRGSQVISDWMTSPITSNQEPETEEQDFGASVDQFFECFDELRSSQSALGNSGMWNWTCSVFSAITAASNLASGSLHIPTEQKHVETSLKARITQITIVLSFVDADQKDVTSYVHYLNADFHDLQFVLQVCPQQSNFEATVNQIEVCDHFSMDFQNETAYNRTSLIKNKQAAVERACPPLSFSGNDISRHRRSHVDLVKVLLFKTSSTTRCQYITPSVSGPKLFSLKLPPLVFWVNFHLVTTLLDLVNEIGNSLKIPRNEDIVPKSSHKESFRCNISLLDARFVLCFPCEVTEDFESYLSWNKFIVIDLSSPLTPIDRNNQLSQRFHVKPSRSLHMSLGNIAVYYVSSVSNLKYRAERVLTVSDKAGCLSVFNLIWQDTAVTGPHITKRVKALAFSESRSKFTGKSHGFAFVNTTKDMEEFTSRTREELVTSSSFFLHAHLSPVTINLNRSLYQNILDHLNQVTNWMSCISSNKHTSSSQSSILVQCDLVEVSVNVSPTENINGSIQNELPGSWCNLKLKVGNFELLTVSNLGGILGADLLWVSHGAGNLWGSTTGVDGKEFMLISCDNRTRGRGNGEGSNILSSRLTGSDIFHMWDPENAVSHLSVNIRCATLVAVGGRLDWFDTITSFFATESDSDLEKKDSSFVLNLIDIGLSYEPYSSNVVVEHEQFVAGLLAASSLKLVNFSSANSTESDYEIKVHDLGLLICEESGVKNINGCYSDQNLRKIGYVKVAEETHVEVVLKTNCKNGNEWEIECNESQIVLDTCQDSTFGLVRLASQIQQIFAPDVEESMVHLQTRWDNIQLEQENNKIRSASYLSASASSDSNVETYAFNLMDKISEGAFNLDVGKHERVPVDPVQVFGSAHNEPSSSHAILPEIIDGYFLSGSRPLSDQFPNNRLRKTKSETSTTYNVGNGWYGDFMIVEDHVSGSGVKTGYNQCVETKTQIKNVKVKGRVVLKNINVRWTFYAGSDWQYTRNKSVCLEFALSEIGLRCDVFPDGQIRVSKLSVSVQDFSVNDLSKGAPWIQVLGCYQSKDRPRESRSRALKLDLESVRPHPSTPLEEYRLQISLLPLRLHLHQSQLEFLISFFGEKNPSDDHFYDIVESDSSKENTVTLGNNSITAEALLPYFQKFSVSPFIIRVDYIPSHVDLAALGHGKYVELVNLFQWKGVDLKLKHVQAVGVYGWSSVCETIIGEWLEDISQNQYHKLLKGLPPIRSLVAVGSSAAKLVTLPVKNYKKDRKLVKGMQRGTIAFLKGVSLEAIGLGAHLAAGAHAILVQAEDIISTSPPMSPIQNRGSSNERSSQPKDARQGMQQAFETITDGFGKSASALVQTPLKKYQRGDGVGSALSTAVQAAPGAAIAPASATARAVHSALVGVRNSLDPEHKKDSMKKYLGTTQSQHR